MTTTMTRVLAAVGVSLLVTSCIQTSYIIRQERQRCLDEAIATCVERSMNRRRLNACIRVERIGCMERRGLL